MHNVERYAGKLPANLSHWSDRKLSSIKKTDVQQWVNRLGNKSIHTANRNFDNLRAIYSWAIRLRYFAKENPCKGVDKFKMHARERFLMPDERDRFLAAVRAYPNPTIRDFILVSLGTAARKSNVLAMRWDQIDFTLAQWRIPRTKNDEPLTIGLTEPVLKILKERENDSESEWVFPSDDDSASGHLVTPNKAFKKILDDAKMQDFRIHDLRRTMGSYLAIQGTSMPIIGKALATSLMHLPPFMRDSQMIRCGWLWKRHKSSCSRASSWSAAMAK